MSFWQKYLFETLYTNRHLYRFASTVPFAGQWRTWQQLVLSRLHGPVLELGCGLGDLMADMIEAGYDCRAVEQSKEMVEAARVTLQQRRCGDSTWVVQGSAQCLPFADESFDTVVSTFPSEYIYASNTISEVERVLRPGGRLVVVVGANLLPVEPIQLFLLLTQMCVYGPDLLFRFSREGDRRFETTSDRCSGYSATRVRHENGETDLGITAEVISEAKFELIPLECHGLRRRCERLYSRFWEAYIVSGEKHLPHPTANSLSITD